MATKVNEAGARQRIGITLGGRKYAAYTYPGGSKTTTVLNNNGVAHMKSTFPGLKTTKSKVTGRGSAVVQKGPTTRLKVKPR